MNAAATSPTPRSVASKLNWAAAFRVSSTSSRIPNEIICSLVSGETGSMEDPTPRIRRSVRLVHDHHDHSPSGNMTCGRRAISPTRSRPYHLQQRPSLFSHIPLPFLIHDRAPWRGDFPRPPFESLPTNQQTPAPSSDHHPIAQVKSVA